MEEWKQYKLGELLTLKYGKDHKFLKEGDIPVYGSGGIMRYANNSLSIGPSILIPRKGSLNNIIFVNKAFWTVDTMFWSIINDIIVNPQYLYYYLKQIDFPSLNVGSAVPSLTVSVIENIDVTLPNLQTQNKIAEILLSLESKIELNRRLNDNLEQQAQALFKSWFVDFGPFKEGKFVDSELGMIPESWRVCSAETIFKINIGKTPPRKEQQWFTNINNGNVKWISISDLGSNEIFIEDSKEYLTKEAISKFNIIVVPEDTILVSFKLTVGRVGISNCELTTNEAVARFYLPKSYFREYTYLSLKNYNYARLGSTSSIATAVNSKIIKNMKLLIPPVTIISEFNKRINPLFNAIRIYENEIRNLSKIRNTLLPKLMSGELKINDINN